MLAAISVVWSPISANFITAVRAHCYEVLYFHNLAQRERTCATGAHRTEYAPSAGCVCVILKNYVPPLARALSTPSPRVIRAILVVHLTQKDRQRERETESTSNRMGTFELKGRLGHAVGGTQWK